MSSPSLFAGQKPDDRVGRQTPLADEPLEQRQRVAVEVARGRAQPRVVEDRRVGAAHLPGREERRPVDEVDELGERVVVERPRPRNVGRGGVTADQSIGTRLARASAMVSRFSLAALPARSRRTVSYSSRIPATNASRRSGWMSAPATPTARDASMTWTTGPE